MTIADEEDGSYFDEMAATDDHDHEDHLDGLIDDEPEDQSLESLTESELEEAHRDFHENFADYDYDSEDEVGAGEPGEVDEDAEEYDNSDGGVEYNPEEFEDDEDHEHEAMMDVTSSGGSSSLSSDDMEDDYIDGGEAENDYTEYVEDEDLEEPRLVAKSSSDGSSTPPSSSEGSEESDGGSSLTSSSGSDISSEHDFIERETLQELDAEQNPAKFTDQFKEISPEQKQKLK